MFYVNFFLRKSFFFTFFFFVEWLVELYLNDVAILTFAFALFKTFPDLTLTTFYDSTGCVCRWKNIIFSFCDTIATIFFTFFLFFVNNFFFRKFSTIWVLRINSLSTNWWSWLREVDCTFFNFYFYCLMRL